MEEKESNLSREYLPLESENSEQADLRKRTSNEQKKEIESGRKKVGPTTIAYRKMRRNFDLILLGVIVILGVTIGLFAAHLRYAVTLKEIQTGAKDFVELFGIILATAIAIFWKIYTPPGHLSRKLQSKGNKAEEEIDESGRTIL